MEQTIKISNDRLNIFVLCAKQFCNTTPRSKLWYAADKICKIALKKLKKTNRLRDEKRREFASKKDKGIYDLNDQGGWQFDENGFNKATAAMIEIDEQEVELPIHIIPVGQFDEKALSFDMRDHFEGILIPAINYDEFDIDNFLAPKTDEEKKPETKKPDESSPELDPGD